MPNNVTGNLEDLYGHTVFKDCRSISLDFKHKQKSSVTCFPFTSVNASFSHLLMLYFQHHILKQCLDLLP